MLGKKTEEQTFLPKGEENKNYSDAQKIINILENKNINISYLSESLNHKSKLKAIKSKDPEQKWRYFGRRIKRLSGVYLLQAFGTVLKTVRLLKDEIDEKNNNLISLEERMKLAQFLNENMDILDFLSKDNEDIKNEKIIKKVSNLEEKEDLIPSENPEETKLPELESKFNQINKILDGKNIKKEDQIKLEKLKNFYLQQKNILP